MFTGIVETVGQIADVYHTGAGVRIALIADWIPNGVAVGDSIAINGCCLTVVALDGGAMQFDAGEETLRRTNLGRLTTGTRVNLERSLPVNGRLGGHFVTGHIDCTGVVRSRTDDANWSTFWFELPSDWSRYLASKGSIAVDGVSLTLVDVLADRFSVALIPHTLSVTTLDQRQPGDVVNLEVDILAKYVHRALYFAANPE